VPRSRMSGIIPPLLYIFMAWCSTITRNYFTIIVVVVVVVISVVHHLLWYVRMLRKEG
jgi:hypothetical protein